MTEEITQSIATFSDCSLSNTPVANPVDGLSSLLLVKFLCATLYRMDQHTRLELALSVWKTDVLPLHQCWVLHPVLHGFGCALDRNPQLIFSNQSTGISNMSRRAPALTWVTLFFIRKEAICRAAGKQMKKLRLVVGIGFEPIRYGRELSRAPAPIVYRVERNPASFSFLGFSRWPSDCSFSWFSWFCLRCLRLLELLQPELPEKIISVNLQTFDISLSLTVFFFQHYLCHAPFLAAGEFAGIDLCR